MHIVFFHVSLTISDVLYFYSVCITTGGRHNSSAAFLSASGFLTKLSGML